MTRFADPAAAVAWLRTPEAIRERCGMVYAAAERGALRHFALHPEKLPDLARRVVAVMRENYPDLAIPYHSRWRHFAAGGRDRWAALSARMVGAPREEVARVRFDLAVTSVLLDAGAGETWTYREKASGRSFARSEGLAVASFDLFAAGGFSGDPGRKLRADADGLQAVDEQRLAAAFQAGPDNALVGLAGRAALMRNLGTALEAEPELFGAQARIGNLFDYLAKRAFGRRLAAPEILAAVLRGLSPIWPGREALGGINLGDVWRHPAAASDDLTSGLVPFHKLSQWLAYSLVEPLEEAGIAVTGLDRLTGLPEYRNGGLFIDGGVLAPKHDLAGRHAAGSELVVEWRALTVVLLDKVAELVRAELGLDASELPLAKVLEGGTWAAGRQLAQELRGGASPISVESDGTVF